MAVSVLKRLGQALHTELPFLAPISAVGIATLLVMLAGAIKDMVVAARFGATGELDAFLIALALFLVMNNTLVVALGDAFLPSFVRAIAREGAAAGGEMLRAAMTVGVVTLGMSSLLVVALMPAAFALLGDAFDPRTIELVFAAFVLLIPALLLAGVGAAWPAILNAHGRFRVAALTPAVTPLVTIALLAFIDTANIETLVLGVVVGKLIETVLMGWHVHLLGFSLVPALRRAWSTLTPVLGQWMPLAAAGLLASASTLVDQSMAATLEPGDASLLTFGGRTTAAVVGVGSLALSSVLFPEFSRLVAARDSQRVRQMATRYVVLALVAGTCTAGVLIGASEPIIDVLFQRGAFTDADTVVAARIQAVFALQIPFHVAGMVLVRLLSVLHRNHFLMLSGIAMLALDIVANFALMQVLGVVGVAGSTSAVFVMSFVVMALAARRAIRVLEAPLA